MPQPKETKTEAYSLEKRLEAAETAQTRRMSGESHRAMAQGYRFIGEVVGGVLMGAGLGWLLDRFVGSAPLGLIGGLLIGSGLSIFVAVRTATRMSKDAMAKAGPTPSVIDDEDED
ncbi:AtpZ/AtpI family protein [Phenylobacterium sp.]|uniref:AtpZ/AtpI family protein n=1 Tax=Phenylobacterium sp. TaxID=1871053 RepID=UPI0030F49071